MIYVIMILCSIVVDQVTKYYAVLQLKGAEAIAVIPGFLYLNYVENRGAAFGIFQDARIFFIVTTLLILLGLLYFVRKHTLTKLAKVSIALIIGGALGNFIDRIRWGYVVDMIDVVFGKVYDFPVFNFADCCVVVGTFLFAILVATNRYEVTHERV